MSNSPTGLVFQFFSAVITGFIVGWLFKYPITVGIAFGFAWCGLQLRSIYQVVLWARDEITDDPPDITGFIGELTYRISKQRQMFRNKEDELKTQLAWFQGGASALEDALIIVNQANQLVWANLAAMRLTGLSEVDQARSILNIFRNPEFVEFFTVADDSSTLSLPSDFERDKWLEYRLRRFGHNDRILIIRDVTEAYKNDHMRRDFVANASHELRTPLTVILGYLEMLSEEPFPVKTKKILETMFRQSQRMETLVSDLLTLSTIETKPEANKTDIVNMVDLLQHIYQEAILLSDKKNHVIELEIANEVNLLGNAKELESVAMNLVSNAVRYTPERALIRILFGTTDDKAILSVEDSGDGILPEHLPRLTERFYRVDSARSRDTGGTGLGLAIVKHVLERHNAVLSIDSVPGRGSRFSCHFPLDRVVKTN